MFLFSLDINSNIMKYFAFLFTLLCFNTFAQSKYLTKTGIVIFEASVPSFEEVKATNTTTTAIYNKDNNEFAALVLVKGFRFKNALMEEHFNENYAESDTYPKATFKGKINVIKNKHSITGSLNFHGKTLKVTTIPLTVLNENSTIKILGKFTVNATDFDIKIPKIVKNKVSETIEVSFEFNMKKK